MDLNLHAGICFSYTRESTAVNPVQRRLDIMSLRADQERQRNNVTAWEPSGIENLVTLDEIFRSHSLCSGGGPAQHARVDPTRNKLTVVQIAEKLSFVDDHLTAQNDRNRPAFDFPSFPRTVIAYVESSRPRVLLIDGSIRTRSASLPGAITPLRG